MEELRFLYENGIADYVQELAGETALTSIQTWDCQREGRDREDKPDYKVKLSVSFTFSNRCSESNTIITPASWNTAVLRNGQ